MSSSKGLLMVIRGLVGFVVVLDLPQFRVCFDNLFFEAVKNYMLVYKVKDRSQAIKDINQLKRIVKPRIEAYENEIKRKLGSGS